MIGRVFNNRYQITERIGIGGMAEVYQAQDNVLGRRVAVKVMLPQYAADPAFAQRFRQEAASAANLQSPYIVNVYDWGQDDGTYYIVMEFIRGTDLKTGIVQRGALNQRKVAEIGSQVCQALSVAHNQDIIHRDIKPQNIMVQPDGNVKVMDFGIARAKNSVNSKTSTVLGTAHYISPEQAQGKELTAASDIYSLGVVLFEAATGKLPFDGPDAISVAMKQVNEEAPLPSDFKPDIDPGLESIIVKAMQKNPAERFATANDMRLALNDFLAGRPVNVGPAAMAGGFTSEQTRVMGPVDGRAASADSTMVMPQGAVKPVSHSGQTAYRATDTMPEEKGGKKKVGLIVGLIAAIAVIAIAALAFSGAFASGDPVPDVKGKTLEEATSIIEKAGFAVGTTNSVHDDSVAAGSVVSQDPTAGTKKPAGTKINLNISQGTEQVTVPDITGKTPDEAQQLADKAGLTLKAGTPVYDDKVEKGKISTQDLKAGDKAAKGSVITYALSLGSEKVAVPDVTGKSESDARAALKNAGFEVSVSQESSSKVEKGYVIRQSPSSSESADKGATVSITVSSGSKTTSVPNVVGKSEGSAQTTLSNAGFNVSTEYTSSSSVSKGNVISQTPESGTSLEPGKTVHLVISTGSSSSNSGSGNGNNSGSNSGNGSNGGNSNSGNSTSSGSSSSN